MNLPPAIEAMREMYIASRLRDAAAGTLTTENMRTIMAAAVAAQLAAQAGKDVNP